MFQRIGWTWRFVRPARVLSSRVRAWEVRKSRERSSRCTAFPHYPDATGTLRLSFGQAKGPVNDDGIGPFVTTIGGAFVRSTGRDPFALPVSWLQAKEKLNLDLPLNVATTNETVGGNSGSPLLNKNAELIGLVFDSNLSGRGNAYLYRTEDRTVAVDSACILEILSKVYGANRIVSEIRAANRR